MSVTFASIALIAAGIMSVATYVFGKEYLLDQRERLAAQGADLNAQAVLRSMEAWSEEPSQALASLPLDLGTQVVLHIDGQWYVSDGAVQPDTLPASLVAATESGETSVRRTGVDGMSALVVGIPLVAVDGEFYQVAPLARLESTLGTLGRYLTLASAATTAVGALLGYYGSRRLLRPLRQMSDVAVDIAGGNLDQRLDSQGDTDLDDIVDSFNDMVTSLRERIGREERFSADVSHELRTPLTALSAAVSVLEARSDELSPSSASAVGVMAAQVGYFERLVLDLLELARLDAGVETVNAEVVDAVAFVGEISRAKGGPVVTQASPGPWNVPLDKHRVERILSNLFDNAERYAGGVTSVTLRRAGQTLEIVVDDNGPGLPPSRREQAFQRFWRGSQGGSADTRGTGLGLALVADSVRLLCGTVEVTDAPGGGARFVVRLPIAVAAAVESA